MKETGAPLAGEMSGHIFFKDRWYGFDDGLYAGARLLEILSRDADPSKPCSRRCPIRSHARAQRRSSREGENHALIDELQKTRAFPTARPT